MRKLTLETALTILAVAFIVYKFWLGLIIPLFVALMIYLVGFVFGD